MMKLNHTFFIIFTLFSTFTFTQGPNATFNVSSIEVCAGETITFTSTSSPGTNNSAIVKEKWDFGDGTTSGDLLGSQNSISHTYSNAGTYLISFFVTDDNNITTSNPESGETHLQIKVNEIPAVDFVANVGSCSLPVDVTFTNSSSNMGNYNFSWDFDNGTTSFFFDPGIISYTTAKNYNVSLSVLDTLTGCYNSKINQLTINSFNADFELSSDTICQNSSIVCSDLSSTGVNEWIWDNGNGETKNNQNPSFIYSSEGEYNITLTAINSSNNCSDIVTKEIVVLPLPFIDMSASSKKGCSPLSVDFTNANINPSINYSWDFGDGSNLFLGDTPPPHNYISNGIFTVSLTATSNFGCQSIEVYTDFIEVTPAIADFNSNIINGCDPLDIKFNDLSQSPNPSEDPIISWNWDFGNGNSSTLENPNIETYNIGKYDISLSITTQKGCNASVSKSEYVQVGQIDSVGFTLDSDTICAKSSVQFTDLSYISITHDPSEVIYAWDFGDGGTDGSKNPNWSYPSDTGSFDVKLVVDIRGCKDSFNIENAVFVWAPIANFTPSQFSYCNPTSFPVQVDVNDQAIIGRDGDDVEMIYRWGDSGNNITNFNSSNFDPDNDQWSSSFNYNDYGTYNIKQVVYNNTSGCSDSIIQTIAISAVSPGLSLSSDSICQFSSVDISDLSTSVLGNIVAIEYNTGDSIINGNVASVTQYIYNTSNSYNIQITATDEFGCESSNNENIKVLALPVADILPSKTGACALENIIYQNMSGFIGTTHASSISISNWVKPDLTIESTNNLSDNINYVVPDTGEFKTYLTVIDNFGCTSFPDSVSVFVTIPTPKYDNPTTICNNSSFTIFNNSVGEGILSSEWSVDNNLVSNLNDLNYTFNEPFNGNQYSNHKLTLVVTDENGCIDSLSKNLLLSIPNSDFTPTAMGVNQSAAFSFSCPPVYVDFVNNSTTPNNSLWNFGNGNTSTQENPEATYIQPGIYTVSLSITNTDGCMDDTTLIDYLSIGGPKGTPYVFNEGDFCKNNFVFYLTDTAQIDNIIWDFDDNSNSSIDSIVHNYPIGGSYFPTLTISDSYNCSIIYNLDTINLVDELISKFTVSNNPGKTNEEIIFTDLSTSITPIVKWTWELNDFDGEVIILDTSSSIIKAYEYPFTYFTVLTVTDLNGCSSSDTIPLKISGDFEVPNVFTPNFDNINDVFAFNQDIFDHYNVLIFNRWGNIVFEKQNVTGTAIWNGMDNVNKKCTDGVYFFQVNGFLKDLTPFEKSGYVTKITGY